MERIGVDLMIVTVIGKICREFDKRNKRAHVAWMVVLVLVPKSTVMMDNGVYSATHYRNMFFTTGSFAGQ